MTTNEDEDSQKLATSWWLKNNRDWTPTSGEHLCTSNTEGDLLVTWMPEHRCITIANVFVGPAVPFLFAPTRAQVLALSELLQLYQPTRFQGAAHE